MPSIDPSASELWYIRRHQLVTPHSSHQLTIEPSLQGASGISCPMASCPLLIQCSVRIHVFQSHELDYPDGARDVACCRNSDWHSFPSVVLGLCNWQITINSSQVPLWLCLHHSCSIYRMYTRYLDSSQNVDLGKHDARSCYRMGAGGRLWTWSWRTRESAEEQDACRELGPVVGISWVLPFGRVMGYCVFLGRSFTWTPPGPTCLVHRGGAQSEREGGGKPT